MYIRTFKFRIKTFWWKIFDSFIPLILITICFICLYSFENSYNGESIKKIDFHESDIGINIPHFKDSKLNFYTRLQEELDKDLIVPYYYDSAFVNKKYIDVIITDSTFLKGNTDLNSSSNEININKNLTLSNNNVVVNNVYNKRFNDNKHIKIKDVEYQISGVINDNNESPRIYINYKNFSKQIHFYNFKITSKDVNKSLRLINELIEGIEKEDRQKIKINYREKLIFEILNKENIESSFRFILFNIFITLSFLIITFITYKNYKQRENEFKVYQIIGIPNPKILKTFIFENIIVITIANIISILLSLIIAYIFSKALNFNLVYMRLDNLLLLNLIIISFYISFCFIWALIGLFKRENIYLRSKK